MVRWDFAQRFQRRPTLTAFHQFEVSCFSSTWPGVYSDNQDENLATNQDEKAAASRFGREGGRSPTEQSERRRGREPRCVIATGLAASDAKGLRELEAENGRLKKLHAEAELDKSMLRDVLSNKW